MDHVTQDVLAELRRLGNSVESALETHERQTQRLRELHETLHAATERLSEALESRGHIREHEAIWPQGMSDADSASDLSTQLQEVRNQQAATEAEARRAAAEAEEAGEARHAAQRRLHAASRELAEARAERAVLESQLAALEDQLAMLDAREAARERDRDRAGESRDGTRDETAERRAAIKQSLERAREREAAAEHKYDQAARESEVAARRAADSAALAERALAHRDELAARQHTLKQARARGGQPDLVTTERGEGGRTTIHEVKRHTRRPSARTAVLRALTEFHCVLSTEELGDLAPFYGLKPGALGSRRFGSLRRDEYEAHQRGSKRHVWLAAALDEHGHAVRNLWVQSTMPLSRRVIPNSSEASRLRRIEVAARACDLASEESASEEFLEWVLSVCAHAHIVRGVSEDVPRWRQAGLLETCREGAANSLDSPWVASVREQQQQAARRLAHTLTEAELIFGVDVVNSLRGRES